MNKKKHKKTKHSSQQALTPNHSASGFVDRDQRQVEELPSVEWGDRINSGKNIARGGKSDGFVPGAMPAR